MMQSLNIGAIILAAGASRRMGRTKQTLPYRHTTLVGHALEQAQLTNLEPIVVVVGAQAEIVRSTLPDTVHSVHNEQWSRGMGSSLACGIQKLVGLPARVEATMVMLADQPRVDASLLQYYVRTFYEHPCDAVALQYPSGPGVPALFAPPLFDQLADLDSDGAKAVLRNPDYVVRTADRPEACLDIDTYEAYQQLLR